MDATVAPQNITFPTDLKLLNAAREKSEELIDRLYSKDRHGDVKPRTCRNIARKEFLDIAKKKNKTARQLYKANGKQLRFLKRNLSHIESLLQAKPLGRPAASALSNHVSPGERNPIEGKFGQAKAGYNMECTKAKLKTTSESWIASIILVLNLINLMRQALYCIVQTIKQSFICLYQVVILSGNIGISKIKAS